MRTRLISSHSLQGLLATQRDALLGNVAEEDLDGVTPGRGEHNPTAELGFEPLRAEDSQTAALREAITSLSGTARQEYTR